MIDIFLGDCINLIPVLNDNSIDCFISDIPYGISFDTWDVLHNNTNSALLGSSPAQKNKSGFKRRGKPLNGWSKADKLIPKEYQDWCFKWTSLLYDKMKPGSSLFVFSSRRMIHRAMIAFEDSGFVVKDVIVWKKKNAHHRAQRISNILSQQGLTDLAFYWKDWRLGNLAPIWEPIIWFFKPYNYTITDNVINNNLGAINPLSIDGINTTNVLDFWFSKNEPRIHENQKPIALIEALIKLTTIENQLILDIFCGSGTTAIAARNTNRSFIGFEKEKETFDLANSRLNE